MLGDKGWINNSKDFVKVLNEKSDQWRNRKDNGSTVIVLHSCRVGRDNYEGKAGKIPESFAKRMSASAEFKDVTIIAPDERVIFRSPKGKPEEAREIGPRKAKYGQKNSDYKMDDDGNEKPHEMGDEKGNWNVYKNGEKIGSYDGDWTPKGDPGIIDNMMHKN